MLARLHHAGGCTLLLLLLDDCSSKSCPTRSRFHTMQIVYALAQARFNLMSQSLRALSNCGSEGKEPKLSPHRASTREYILVL